MGSAIIGHREAGRTFPWRSIHFAILRLLALALFVIFAPAYPSGAQESVDGVIEIEGFDHSQFGIPLTGAHAQIICESCHIDNTLAGTPQDCAGCHNGTIAAGQPASHPPAGNECAQCHTTNNFVPFAFDHTNVNQPCASCHNGASARGKPANHIPASDTCDDCHVTTNIKEVRVDHNNVEGTCVSCHNGKTAPGQPKDHVAASDDCAACHSTMQFAGAIVDHSFINQPCAACHDGVTAIGKPANHMPAPETCGDCHTPFFEATFASVNFDHSNVVGDCASCHLGGDASGAPLPPDWHFVVDMTDCESCHVPGNPFAMMDHTRATPNVDCVTCHFSFAGNPPSDPNLSTRRHSPSENCAGCHL
jgi:hypothetical protein